MDSSDGNEASSLEDRGPKKRDHEKNEVYLSTIHKAKGKEFQNVIYFNLSQAEQNSQKAQFIEEERRVAYVGATRAKDDLLITFSSSKPSDFLMEISLNPKFKALKNEELKQKHASSMRRLEKERAGLKEIQARKETCVTLFNELLKQQFKGPVWFSTILSTVQNWRINHLQAKIASIDQHIKEHVETTIDPLLYQLSEMEAEENIRVALGMKQ
jgi:ATP-dependent exoDNAse (exonuclease V) beta subunit